ncbi:elongation factor P, partial [Candidatus Omnitrophota bacterium]
MAVSINEVKAGLTILVGGQAYMIVEAQHVKPGKGSAFVRVKLRHIKTGAIHDKTFRGIDKVERAFIEERRLEYLYCSGDIFHFMDQKSFEEVAI